MKLLPIFFLSASAERLDRRLVERKKITLSPEAQKQFNAVDEILDAMAEHFNGLKKVGKKDYKVNAKGMEKWKGKLKKAHNDRSTKCVPKYWKWDEYVLISFLIHNFL